MPQDRLQLASNEEPFLFLTAYGDNEAAFGQSTVNDSLEQHLALQHLGRRGCIKQVLYTK